MTDRITVGDCMRSAFEALLRGDTDERDRLCRLAETAFGSHDWVPLNTPVAEVRSLPAVIYLPAPDRPAPVQEEGETR